jgi:hypothetical protein
MHIKKRTELYYDVDDKIKKEYTFRIPNLTH